MVRPRKADVHQSASRGVVGPHCTPTAAAPGVPGAGRWENPAAMSPKLSSTLQPEVVAGVAIAAGAYVRRWRRVRRGSSPHLATDAPAWRLCCFLGSLTLALVALISPVD